MSKSSSWIPCKALQHLSKLSLRIFPSLLFRTPVPPHSLRPILMKGYPQSWIFVNGWMGRSEDLVKGTDQCCSAHEFYCKELNLDHLI